MLAKFVIAWPNLQHDVAALAAMTPGAADPGDRLANMTGAFGALITDLAGGFSVDAMDASQAGGDNSQTYAFLLDTTYDVSGRTMETVELTLQPDSTADDIPWPAIWVTWTSADGSRRPAGCQRTPSRPAGHAASITHRTCRRSPRSPIGSRCRAAPCRKKDAQDKPHGRDAVRWQSGTGAAAVRRNADLVGGAAT